MTPDHDDGAREGGHHRLRRVWPWLAVAAALGLTRTLAFVLYPTISFDADQAVVGLMAKHIAEGRAWPVHQYALPYVVEITPYLAAPFMWLLGPTIVALRLPLLLMNIAVGVGLVAAIVRAGVGPRLAVVAALPVLLAPPATSAALMDALGMTIEPLGFVLALWWLRRRPVAFGIVAALGFRVREFVAYGVAAAIVVDLWRSYRLDHDRVRHWSQVGIAAAAAFAMIGALARFETPMGPGTWVGESGSSLTTLSGAFCFEPRWAWRNTVDLGARYLAWMYGAVPLPLEMAMVRSQVVQGAPGLWLLVGGTLLAVAVRVLLGWRVLWQRRTEPAVGLGLFLALVGVQAAVVYAFSRCGPISLATLRYVLLALFLPTGLVVLVLQVERRTVARGAVGIVLLVLAAVSLRDHARLLIEQRRTPHVANRVVLADALLRDGVRYGYSDYWTAYYVAFWTQERILIVPDGLSRIAFYEQQVEAHADRAVRIAAEPCGDTPPVAPGYHVCDAPR